MAITSLQRLLDLSPINAIALLVVVSPLFYIAYSVIYNLYFSPLSKFPGPKLWACTEFFYQRATVRGVAHQEFLKLFRQYGPVVRITPNELIFSSAQAVRDIHGTLHVQKQLGGKKEVLGKDERFYNSFGMPKDHLVSTLDHNVHARQRRMIGTAFSERAVREQEPMLVEHIDKLIAGIRREGVERGKEVDIKQWINYTTFDITGYIVFGESFHCLDDGALHPWVAFMTDSIKAQVLMGLFLRVPGMKALMPYIVPKKTAIALAEHQSLSYNRLEQRLEQGQTTEKADLVGLLLKNGITQKAGGFSSGEDHISHGELHANVTILILAGSETSATLLTGAIYFLLSHPTAYNRLTDEIRSAFSSPNITLPSLTPSHLPYLHACIQETFRMYPPASLTMPRRTPTKGAVIDGYEIPGDTYVGFPHFSAYRYKGNFERAGEWWPGRWLGEGKEDVREVLQPFSVGSYACLGQNLAWAEIRLILCRLLWHFDFELCPGQERWYEDQKVFLVWEKPELKIKVKERAF